MLILILILIQILLISWAGILIIITIMHNVKTEPLTGNNDKAVSGDEDEKPCVK